MIIATNEKLELGRICHENSISDSQGKPAQLTFLIIRESNREEFVAHVAKLGWTEERLKNTDSYHAAYYYEVSTD